MQWFDLKDLGGKLERSQEPEGAYFMRLSFAEPCDARSIINSALEGWVATEERPGTEFRNYRDFTRTSAIVSALEPFFERDQIVLSKVDSAKLRQGEELRGYINPIGADLESGLYPSKSEVAQNLARMLNEDVRQRILDRVLAAQEVMGTAPNGVSFEGRAVEVWRSLSANFGYHDATAVMLATFGRAKSAGERFAELHDAALNAAATGKSLPKLDDGLRADSEALQICERYRTYFQDYGDDALGWDEEYVYRGFTRAVDANFAVWDNNAIGMPIDDPDGFGARLAADPSMPVSWKSGMLFRASKAIEQSARMLATSPRELFATDTTFHLGKRVGYADALGYHREFRPIVAGEALNMRTIKFSPHRAGVMVHEMGHAIDLSHRQFLKTEDADALLLDETGIREFVEDMVDARDDLDEGYKRYLKSPKEIVARSFEAALADHQRGAGERDFAKAGGVVALNGGFDYAPPAELTQKFVHALQGVMNIVRSYKLDAEDEKRISVDP